MAHQLRDGEGVVRAGFRTGEGIALGAFRNYFFRESIATVGGLMTI